ncbi:winged helix-turn-helix transcriptional regulator [Bacillus benzoevorans]|uniref:DNA-binding HxlR family transcriptional regulator n=1 Tax=Bacillus benzoevorans TaxID=1456 RepID=A0A7X0HQC0_9BACI|nr:helix-turn-helix domain-containing protein [Bacillus benzoevorans]MBB6444796.1 DNA-binding HxlR family transcriptional regulator [Bacillus benzoevorans]
MSTKICPYIEASFEIIGKKWNGQLIHYLSLCENQSAHFSDLKKDVSGITPKALSMRLSELIEIGLLEKNVTNTSPVAISYSLTEKGAALAESLKSIQEWAIQYLHVECETPNESEENENDEK